MDMGQLSRTLKKIEMPPQMRERIISRCGRNEEERQGQTMQKTGKIHWKRTALTAAIVAAVACASVVGVAAVTGYFRDVKRADGAVVGTAYEQASEEIRAEATVRDGALTVTVTMLSPQEPPYSACEQLAVGHYQITDMAGSVLAEGDGTDACPVSGGQAEISIELDGLGSGEYKLRIDQFIAGKKADQPLPISGGWECSFRV